MEWSPEQKRFAGAGALFLVWIAVLTGLAVVSSQRPAARSPRPEAQPVTAQPVSEDEK